MAMLPCIKHGIRLVPGPDGYGFCPVCNGAERFQILYKFRGESVKREFFATWPELYSWVENKLCRGKKKDRLHFARLEYMTLSTEGHTIPIMTPRTPVDGKAGKKIGYFCFFGQEFLVY